MAASLPGSALRRHHHITLCTGDAQEDYDFHTKVLGLKSVKKTLLYDGQMPIYHLYYGNDVGTESSLVTSFPMRHTGGTKARRGSGQITTSVYRPRSRPSLSGKLALNSMVSRSKKTSGWASAVSIFNIPAGSSIQSSVWPTTAARPIRPAPCRRIRCCAVRTRSACRCAI